MAARSSVGAAGPDEPSEGVHLRSGYFASRRQQKTPRDVLVTYTRTRQSADGDVVEVLSTEKLVPISDDDVDDLVEVIAAERKLQDTQAEGIREVYKKPNKNYNNPKKKSSSSSSRKKGSSSSKSKSKKKSPSSSKSKSKKKSKESTKKSSTKKSRSDKKKRKSRSKRKRKKSLFKKKSKKSTSKSGSKCKVDKVCRDDCIIENKCDWAKDNMCDKKCKQDCCLLGETSADNETGDSDDEMGEPTAAPVANGGGGPAPEPTTLQPVVAPVAITPAPTVPLPEPRTCPSDVAPFTFAGSLGCNPGGCCIVASDSASMQDLCNFPALSTAGVASIENGQIFVEDIDTTGENGPFEIQEGCEISCTSQCRVSPIVPQIPEAPADLTTYSGPGTISCTDGYCETDNASGCNIVGFNAVGNVGVNDAGKAVAYNIDSAAAPVAIEGGCLIDCSESTCTFGRAR